MRRCARRSFVERRITAGIDVPKQARSRAVVRMASDRSELQRSSPEKLALRPTLSVAGEEGFYFPRYEGGIRWHTLVRYTESAANKQFSFTRVNTGFRHHLIPSVFVARVSRHGESTAPSRINAIFRFRPGPGCPTKNSHKAFTSCLSCSSL